MLVAGISLYLKLVLRDLPLKSLSPDMPNCPGVGGSLIKYVSVQCGAVKLFIPLLIPHA